MKNKTYRFAAALAVLLALCLAFVAPVGASGDANENNGVAELGDQYYSTLQLAVNDATDGQTVTLLKDVTSDVIITINKAITLDGDGYTLTSEASRAINVDCSGAVTIKNLTVATIDPVYSEATNPERAINIINKAVTLTLNNVTAEGFKYTINVAASSKGSFITINDGMYSGYSALNICGNDTVVVANDVVFHGNNTAEQSESNNFAAISIGDYANSHYSDNVSITINEGRIIATSTNGNKQFIVSAPGVTDSVVVIDSELEILNNDVFNVANTVNVAGFFRAEYADELAENGYENSYVATIAEGDLLSVYATLEEAIAAAESGDTITLLNNVVVDKEVLISKDRITIDGQNQKYSISSSADYQNAGTASTNYILEVEGNDFTMTGVVLDDSARTQSDITAIAAIRLTGDNAKLTGNKIIAGTSELHRSTGILVYSTAAGTTLEHNEIILGVSSDRSPELEAVSHRNESIGIRIFPGDSYYKFSVNSNEGPTQNLMITGNTFTNHTTATNPQVGILIDGAQAGDSLTVTGNTFNLGSDGIVLEIMSAIAAPSLDLTFSDNVGNTAASLYLLKDKVNSPSDSPAFTHTLKVDGGNIASIKLGADVTLAIKSGKFGIDPTPFVATGFHAKVLTAGSLWEVTDKYTITFNTNGGSAVESITTKAGEAITAPGNPTKSGYTFAGWDPAIPATMPAKDMTITAKWSYNGASSSSTSSSKPTEPETLVEPETPTEPVAGEVTVETEVTNGGEVSFETPAAEGEEPVAGETPADEPAPVEISAVVLPEGTAGEVAFVPVSEQPAPAGKETSTKKVFEINVPNYEKGKPATIKFQMTVAELEADGKTAAQVALWHFDEETGEWTKLVTSYVIVDGVVYFEAITNGFSPFAIIYEDAPAEEPTEEPVETPAPILAVLAGLGAAVVLRRK